MIVSDALIQVLPPQRVTILSIMRPYSFDMNGQIQLFFAADRISEFQMNVFRDPLHAFIGFSVIIFHKLQKLPVPIGR